MKILLVGQHETSGAPSGPVGYARRLFRELLERGEETEFATYFYKSIPESDLWRRFFGRASASRNPNVTRFGAARLLWKIAFGGFDVVHLVTRDRFQAAILWFRFLSRAKIVSTVHGVVADEVERKAETRRDFSLEELLAKGADGLAFVSERHRARFCQRYEIVETTATTAPHGVDERFSAVERKPREESAPLRVLFYVGWDGVDRGFDRFWRSFRKTDADVEIVVLGDVSLWEATDERARGIERKLSSDELAALFSETDALFKSTTVESLSMLALEAAAAGVVPILSDNVGAADYFDSASEAIVYPGESIDEGVAALERLSRDRSELDRRSERCRNVGARLSWRRSIDRHLEFYREVVGEGVR
jgi:glycosyltransferase involved in cell wall biosynthesis